MTEPHPSAEFLEAEYNNRARVPEHPALIAAWQEKAAAYREARPDAKLDIPYGDGQRQTYDLFPALAQTKEQPRTALFIHGGYWQALSKDFHSHIAKGLNAHGFDVAIANYTLCPQTDIAGIEDEMRALAGHLFHEHGKPLLVSGHSAGGHLTAALMTTNWGARGLPKNLCNRGLPLSGLFDLEPLVPTSVNTALSMSVADARASSPLHGRPTPGSRVIAVVGGDESSEYIRQTRDLVKAWATDDVAASLDIVPQANHFTIIDPLAEPTSQLVHQLLALGTSV